MSENGNVNNNEMRYDNSSLKGELSQDKYSFSNSCSIYVVNSSSEHIINSNNSNDSKKTDKNSNKDSKIIKNQIEPKTIVINRNDDKILIFIRVLGYNMAYHEANINGKIGEIIEKYINKNNLDEKIKNHFFIGDKRIDNLDKTLKDLNVSNLTIIQTK